MGQAKKRGTREERILQARMRNDANWTNIGTTSGGATVRVMPLLSAVAALGASSFQPKDFVLQGSNTERAILDK